MANQEHVGVLRRGIGVWNRWRAQHLNEMWPDLRGTDLKETDLSGANLSYTDFRDANLTRANLTRAILYKVDLNGADLTGATLYQANLGKANLRETNLRRADLSEAKLDFADLSRADLSGADFTRADLSGALLVKSDLSGATLKQCLVHGIAAWKVELKGAEQESLIITDYDEPIITVDNLKVAQFVYLLLDNEEIRDVIDTITTKVVLILGRFTPERKLVLDALRNILHTKNYVPIVFDFKKLANRDTHETITTLARLARFVIADITEAKSIPQELVSIVQTLPSLAVQPLLQHDSEPWGMYDHIRRYSWVLLIHQYTDLTDLLASLQEYVIEPAEQRTQKLEKR